MTNEIVLGPKTKAVSISQNTLEKLYIYSNHNNKGIEELKKPDPLINTKGWMWTGVKGTR